jgi:hypothetical protein
VIARKFIAHRNQSHNYAGASVITLSPAESYLRINHPVGEWSKKINDRLQELIRLPIGWDGYNGIPVSFQHATFAMSLLQHLYYEGLPLPHIVPGNDGSLQIEWHRNNFDIEIDVMGPYDVFAVLYNCNDDSSRDIHLEKEFSELRVWVEKVK